MRSRSGHQRRDPNGRRLPDDRPSNGVHGSSLEIRSKYRSCVRLHAMPGLRKGSPGWIDHALGRPDGFSSRVTGSPCCILAVIKYLTRDRRDLRRCHARPTTGDDRPKSGGRTCRSLAPAAIVRTRSRHDCAIERLYEERRSSSGRRRASAGRLEKSGPSSIVRFEDDSGGFVDSYGTELHI